MSTLVNDEIGQINEEKSPVVRQRVDQEQEIKSSPRAQSEAGDRPPVRREEISE
jgi:hypothetical protein